MSLLILQLPARPKLAAQSGDEQGASVRVEWDALDYVLSNDGLAVTRQARAKLEELPQADQVIAVVAAADLSWHRVQLPKVALTRMAAALPGLLEEGLLGEADQMHYALEPLAKPGTTAWVAACERAWLEQWLARLTEAQVEVDRIVPSVWPDDPPCGYFHEAQANTAAATSVQLTWSSLEGVASWPLHGSLARQLLPDASAVGVKWLATPAVAAPAERWLGSSVLVQTPAEHLLQAAQSMWQLRQFSLAPRHHGLRRLSEYARQFMSREWQPVRVGLAAVVLLQLVGLNAWGWKLNHAIEAKRQAQVSLLKRTHPQVQAVLDAPLQMQRENESLRVTSGQPASTDLESLLQALSLAWPSGSTIQNLSYDGSAVSVQAPGWSDMQTQQLQQALQGSQLQVGMHDGRVVVSRAGFAAPDAASAPAAQ